MHVRNLIRAFFRPDAKGKVLALRVLLLSTEIGEIKYLYIVTEPYLNSFIDLV